MPHCTICHHPQHLGVNQALLSGETFSSHPTPDCLITAHKRPAFLPAPPGPGDPSSSTPSAPVPPDFGYPGIFKKIFGIFC
jgi:hypothetical protein